MSLTIFNVVVDVMVRHWVEVMVEGSGGQSRSNQEGRHQNALLYADDGMLALSDPGCLQGAFSTLVGMFDRVGLNMNVRKTVRIFCCPYQVAGTQSEAEYERRMTGTGPSYRERQCVCVQCSECGEEIAFVSLSAHLQT